MIKVVHLFDKSVICLIKMYNLIYRTFNLIAKTTSAKRREAKIEGINRKR